MCVELISKCLITFHAEKKHLTLYGCGSLALHPFGVYYIVGGMCPRYKNDKLSPFYIYVLTLMACTLLEL